MVMVWCIRCINYVSCEWNSGRLWCPGCYAVLAEEGDKLKLSRTLFPVNKTHGNNNKKQAAKEEAGKAASDINCPEDAKKLEQATAAAVAKKRKRLSSKINFDVLENMLKTSDAPDFSKKRKIDSHLDNDDNMPHELEFDDNLVVENEYEDAEEVEGADSSLEYDDNMPHELEFDDNLVVENEYEDAEEVEGADSSLDCYVVETNIFGEYYGHYGGFCDVRC